MDSTHDESNSSFLSDVLDFVSRELNQFVANATGAPVATEPDTQRHRETQSKLPSELQRVKSIPSHSFTSDSSHVHSKRYYSAAAKHLAPNSAPRRRRPMTMPGALLPRSPTSEPHDVPGLEEGVCQLADIVDVGRGVGERGGPEAAQSSSQAVDRTQRAEVDVQPSKNVSLIGACTSLGGPTQKPGVDMPETVAERNEGDHAIWVPPESSSSNDCEPTGRRVGRSVTRLDEERMQDKEKIRILEEEVRRLREQLSVKRDNMSLIPPPPPPPPPLLPARIKSNHDRVPLDPSDASLLIASARASLKRAPAPVEAAINPSLSTKRQGLPTVGIPPDKMAAFLNEMKSVRLRKIAGTSNRPVSTVNSSADSWSNTSLSFGNSSILSHSLNSKPLSSSSSSSVHSHASNIPTAGVKRKREWFDDGKRRAIPDMPGRIAVVDRARTNELWIGTDQKNSSESSNSANSRSWLSFSITDTTTPSLTSDNDQDITPDDLPATPPQTHAKFSRGILESLEVIDVDDFVTQTNTSGDVTKDLVTEALPAHPSGKPNLFSKRTPLSPLPSDTPRKPQPPSRLRRSPRQKNVVDNNLPSLRDLSTCSDVHQESQPQGRDERLSSISRRSGVHHRRQDRDWWSSTLVAEQEPSSHRTLDKELRRAINSLKSVGENISFDTEECDVFLGTGTRDKSSFSSLPVVERGAENRRKRTDQQLPSR